MIFYNFEFFSSMQEILNQLNELSYNLFWSWNNDFYSIFEELNRDYWNWSQKNPVKFLGAVNKEYLFEIIEKKNLRERISKIYREYRKYINHSGKTNSHKPIDENIPSICYLSAEYGITKCLKFYSGGLGTLSGDHLKSASDLNIPLVAIGLAYSYGYFRQYINSEGRQAELFEKNEFEKMPMKLVLDEDYRPVKITIDLPGRQVFAQIWQVNIGRVKLFLLDTFVDENDVEDKRITDILYGGELEKRILQEILLGIGGMRVMEILNIPVKGCHINEGHSAFLCFERIRTTMKKLGISYKEAKELCYYSNIFTTHTPVPAGIDIFPRWMMEKYFKHYAENELNISFDELFLEGDLYHSSWNENFNMAALAINNSNFINGVSKLHGKIASKMWALPSTRTQIDSITNGVHIRTYLSPNSEKIYRKYFGDYWYNEEKIWEKISSLPDSVIWEMRNKNREYLIKYVREKLVDNLKFRNATDEEIENARNILSTDIMTVGFARRFATYKRGTLIFRDIERLKKIINGNYKIQFIFSGKAHPKDDGGKNLIHEIMNYTRDSDLAGKIVFLDNYDMEVAKYLVSGCDVWLNNPRRPLEASGTSGMKTVANGGLNFSILDGWWVEGYEPSCGWKINSPGEEENLSEYEVDAFEAKSLYDTLETEILPMFYKRNENNIPVEWVQMIKNSIRKLSSYFNTERMVQEYNTKFYSKVIDISKSKM